MVRGFRVICISVLVLHLSYLVSTIVSFDSLPRAIESYELSEFTSDYNRALTVFSAMITESIFLFLGLIGLAFYQPVGRWLLGFGVIAAMVEFFAQPAMTDHGWNAALAALVFSGIGLIVGLLIHPTIRGAFAGNGSKRNGTIILSLLGALGVIALAVGMGVMGKMLRVLPQEPNRSLPSSLDLSGNAEAKLQSWAEQFLEEPANAGIAIGLTIDGQRTEILAGALTRDSNAAPVTSDTLFEIGSLSKTFTGYLLADAARKGAVKLSTPVTEILEVDFAPIAGEPVSLYDLATHYAALPKMPNSLGILQEMKGNPFAGLSQRDLFQSVAKANSEPNRKRRYSYSNIGYSLLLEALVEAEQKTAAELHSELFMTYGLGSTYFSEIPRSERARFATGHNRGLQISTWHDGGTVIDGAGSLVSSLSDLLTWAEAWIATKPDTAMNDALTIRRHRSRVAGDVGIGWNIKDPTGQQLRAHHTGSTGGFRSYIGFAPSAGIGVVLLINSADPAADHIGQEILNSLIEADR